MTFKNMLRRHVHLVIERESGDQGFFPLCFKKVRSAYTMLTSKKFSPHALKKFEVTIGITSSCCRRTVDIIIMTTLTYGDV